MTSPSSSLPPAGLLRDVALGDVAGLATNSAHNHLGLPAGVVLRFELGPPPHVFITDPSGSLTVGDTYLFTVDSLVARATNLGQFISPVIADFLQALGRVAAASAVSVIGLLPLAWDVPQKAGTVTTPAPTPTRTKRPRLPPGPPHVRLTWRGIFALNDAAVETWDWSLKTTQPASPLDGPALVARAQTMSDIWVATVADTQTAPIVLTECIYAVVGADGKVQRFPDGAFVQGKVEVSHKGANTAQGHMPLQTALVVSLGSARPGATGRGRFFLPLQDPAQIADDFRVTDAFTRLVASRASALVSQVNAMGSRVVVNSSKGYASPVVNVRVGRAPDTMRSRREKVAESYIFGPALT